MKASAGIPTRSRRVRQHGLRRLIQQVLDRATSLAKPIDYQGILDLEEVDHLLQYLASSGLTQFGVSNTGVELPASKAHLVHFYIAPALAVIESKGVGIDEVYAELEDSFLADCSTWTN